MTRLVSLGLAATAAGWALTNRGAALRLARRARSLVAGPSGAPPPGSATDRGGDLDQSDVDAPLRPWQLAPVETARDTVPAPEADGAVISELLGSDPEVLVEAERELLTVPGEPGEGHRRRDQTAGVAAQQLAAAQVRSRRNGIED